MKTHLEATVELRNRLATEHNRLQQLLHAAFSPLVGSVIFKGDKTLRAKYTPLVPTASTGFRMRQLDYRYMLSFTITTEVAFNGGIVHNNININVGSLDVDGTLLKIHELPPAKDDYTVQFVLDAKANIEKTKKEFEAAKLVLADFE